MQEETGGDIAPAFEDLAALEDVQPLLDVICQTTGMGFAAVARVTPVSWTALAVRDLIGFGLQPGQQLDVHTTLCKEVMDTACPIAIDHASQDPLYRDHHTPRIYQIESYISVPIVLADGEYFGNLCAIDPQPANVRQPHVMSMFRLFSRFLAMLLDSHRRREVAEAATLKERANSALREQFIAIMGHDLRNPLAGIDAGIRLLPQMADDPAAVRRVAARMGNSARRMKLLIDDVLDFARGRLGGGIGLNIAVEPQMDAAMEQVVSELQAVYPTRLINAQIAVAQPVSCDVARVQQLLSNLLANALAHGSERAPVNVRVALNGKELEINVSNDGQPIAPDLLPKLFNAFSKGAMLYDRKGLGLGLFICSQIVKGHRGTITVSSDAQRGTTFSVKLPMFPPLSAAAAA